ncbi:MAG: hypothetical protein D6776_09750 [Planctomycetota bacterium]|nr:MAG: hypothetical protein D6776_09750 [Planctomycetota bacterium]
MMPGRPGGRNGVQTLRDTRCRRTPPNRRRWGDRRRVAVVVLALAAVGLLAGPALAQQPAAPLAAPDSAGPAPLLSLSRPWEAEQLDPKAIEAAIEEAQAALTRLGGAETDPTAASLRQPLENRIALLRELLEVLRAQSQWRQQREQAPGQLEAQRKLLETLRAAPPEPLPADVTEATLAAVREQLQQQRKAWEEAQQSVQSLESRAREIPDAMRTSRQSEDEAKALAARREEELGRATDPGSQLVLRVRKRNQELRQRVERERRAALEAELAANAELAKLARLRADLAQARLRRLEQHLEALQSAYAQALERKRREAEAEAQRRLQEAEAARRREPAQRLIADLEAQLAQIELHNVELEREVVELQRQANEEQSQLERDQRERGQLELFVRRLGGTQAAAQRLKLVFEELKATRPRLLPRQSRREQLARLYLRKTEVEHRLAALDEELRTRLEPVLRDLGPEAQFELRSRVAELETRIRTALLRTLELLDRGIDAATAWETARAERIRVLDATFAFVLRRVFWIRDAEPIDPGLVRTAFDEFERIMGFVWNVPESVATSIASRRPIEKVWLGAVAFVLLLFVPAGLAVLRSRLRYRDGETRLQSGEIPVLDGTEARSLPWKGLGRAALGACVWPAYLATLGVIAYRLSDAHGGYAVVGRGLLAAAAVVLVRGLSRALLRRRGVLVRGFGLDERDAMRLDRLFRLAALSGWLAVAWIVLDSEAVGAPALARLAWTAFYGALTLTAIAAFRRGSPLASLILGDAQGLLWRNWRLLWGLGSAGAVALVVLDALGYRFGAQWVAVRAGASLAVIAATAILYRSAAALSHGIASRAAQARIAEQRARGEREDVHAPIVQLAALAEQREVLRRQIVGAIRAILLVVATLGLISVWNVDAQLLQSLDEVTVFRVAEGESGITYGDLARALIAAIVTGVLLRNLDGFLELFILPRLRDDAGLRYAVRTMARYAVFLVGGLVTLRYLQVPFDKLGWIVAAASVGIGFGLQDVVANFISGLIILLERPVAVGDIVRVGETEGTVNRISIRATEVQNWDNQTIIIPNRFFISNNVINWTHNDRIVRYVFEVGVEYGTDIERARTLLLEVVRAHPLVLEQPEPSVWFARFGASSLDFSVRYFVHDPKYILRVRSELGAAIQRRLKEAGIQVPFSQHDVHLDFVDPRQLAEEFGLSRSARSEEGERA